MLETPSTGWCDEVGKARPLKSYHRTGQGRRAPSSEPHSGAAGRQGPAGKRSWKGGADSGDDVDVESSDEVEDSNEDKKTPAAKKAGADKKAKKPKKPGARTANPFVFVYNYLKQVVAEMRKV